MNIRSYRLRDSRCGPTWVLLGEQLELADLPWSIRNRVREPYLVRCYELPNPQVLFGVDEDAALADIRQKGFHLLPRLKITKLMR